MPDITVLLSTHNNQDILQQTLQGYNNLENIDLDWEMIVVNNASTDRTQEILEEFTDRLPLRILNHSILGKNRALNSALKYISSGFVVLTDDDAIPQKDFLKNWVFVSDNNPHFDVFGGTIEPYFQARPPEWMVKQRFHFGELFSARDMEDGRINARQIFGPNMAVRRKIFEGGIVFNENIGPNGNNKNYPMGSETEFLRRIENAGIQAFFAKRPRVKHIVRPHQITKDFWTNRAYKHGLGTGLQSKPDARKELGSELRLLLKYALKQFVELASSKLDPDKGRRSEHLWQYYWEKGLFASKKKDLLQKSVGFRSIFYICYGVTGAFHESWQESMYSVLSDTIATMP